MPRLWIQIAAIISLTLAVYQAAPHAQFMPVDDGSLSFENPIVKEFDLQSAFTTYDPELYIPLTLLSYQIEYFFAEDNPMVYHVTNVVLHIFNAILVLLLVRFWTKRWEIPFLTAILFAVHPINTEAVMWISGRKDLLSVFFLLGSTIAYCKHRVTGDKRFFYVSLVLFLLGLFTKVLVVTLPLLFIILDDLIPAQKKIQNEKLSKWAFYVPAFAFLGIAMIRKFISVYSITYTQSILLACKSIAFYLKQLLLPMNLSMFYRQTTPIELSNPEFFLSILVLIALAVIVLESKRLGKTFAFGMLWFGITVLPNLANASKGGKADIFYGSDRYLYVACIGIFFLMSYGLVWVLDHSEGIKRHLIVLLMIALPCSYALHANRYSREWLDAKGYMEYVVERYPETPVAHTIIGLKELQEDNEERAMEHFRYALSISPQFTVPRAHLGLSLMKTGNVDEGLAEIQKIQEVKPDLEYTYTFMAFGHTLKDEDEIAEGLLKQVLSILPDDSKALQMMGTIAARRGDAKEAHAYYERAIAVNPDDVRPKVALVRLLKSQ